MEQFACCFLPTSGFLTQSTGQRQSEYYRLGYYMPVKDQVFNRGEQWTLFKTDVEKSLQH